MVLEVVLGLRTYTSNLWPVYVETAEFLISLLQENPLTV